VLGKGPQEVGLEREEEETSDGCWASANTFEGEDGLVVALPKTLRTIYGCPTNILGLASPLQIADTRIDHTPGTGIGGCPASQDMSKAAIVCHSFLPGSPLRIPLASLEISWDDGSQDRFCTSAP
jgi:hypothetical protein